MHRDGSCRRTAGVSLSRRCLQNPRPRVSTAKVQAAVSILPVNRRSLASYMAGSISRRRSTLLAKKPGKQVMYCNAYKLCRNESAHLRYLRCGREETSVGTHLQVGSNLATCPDVSYCYWQQAGGDKRPLHFCTIFCRGIAIISNAFIYGTSPQECNWTNSPLRRQLCLKMASQHPAVPWNQYRHGVTDEIVTTRHMETCLRFLMSPGRWREHCRAWER